MSRGAAERRRADRPDESHLLRADLQPGAGFKSLCQLAGGRPRRSGHQQRLDQRHLPVAGSPARTAASARLRRAFRLAQLRPEWHHRAGQPAHSPLAGQSVSTSGNNVTISVPTYPNVPAGPVYSTTEQSLLDRSDLGNLLNTDTNSLSVAGNLQKAGQVDWYKFSLNYDLTQAIRASTPPTKRSQRSSTLDMPMVLRRIRLFPCLSQYGNLVLVSRADSNTADQQPRPTQGTTLRTSSHVPFGTLDPYIGSAQLPAGYTNGAVPSGPGQDLNGPNSYSYYVAISSDATLPTAMDATFNAAAATRWSASNRSKASSGSSRIILGSPVTPAAMHCSITAIRIAATRIRRRMAAVANCDRR